MLLDARTAELLEHRPFGTWPYAEHLRGDRLAAGDADGGLALWALHGADL